MSILPASIDAFRALCLGFAFAGMAGSAYELVMRRRLSFKALRSGDAAALAAVPVLVFTAPFVIVRNLVRHGGTRRWPFPVVFGGTLVAGFWSLVCGRVVLDAASLLIGA